MEVNDYITQNCKPGQHRNHNAINLSYANVILAGYFLKHAYTQQNLWMESNNATVLHFMADSPRHKGSRSLCSGKCSAGDVWGDAGSCADAGTIPSASHAPLLPGMVLESPDWQDKTGSYIKTWCFNVSIYLKVTVFMIITKLVLPCIEPRAFRLVHKVSQLRYANLWDWITWRVQCFLQGLICTAFAQAL